MTWPDYTVLCVAAALKAQAVCLSYSHKNLSSRLLIELLRPDLLNNIERELAYTICTNISQLGTWQAKFRGFHLDHLVATDFISSPGS